MSGWVRDLGDPSRKVDITVVLPGHGTLAETTADRFSATLVAVGAGDGFYAFHAEFPRALTEAERDDFRMAAHAAMKAHIDWLTLNGWTMLKMEKRPKKGLLDLQKPKLIGLN